MCGGSRRAEGFTDASEPGPAAAASQPRSRAWASPTVPVSGPAPAALGASAPCAGSPFRPAAHRAPAAVRCRRCTLPRLPSRSARPRVPEARPQRSAMGVLGKHGPII